MNAMQKFYNYSILLVLISTMCLVALLVSCGNKEEDLKTKEATKEVANKMKELFSKPDQEAVALLSKKYSIDVNTLEKIIDHYLNETDFTYRVLKKSHEFQKTKHDFMIASGAIDKSVYLKLVNKLSEEFSIDSQTIASILYDYRLWDTANEGAQSISRDD